MVKMYNGIVNKDIYYEFDFQRGYNLFSHGCNGCRIEDYIAIANIFCPDIIEVDGYIFLAEQFNTKEEDAQEELERLKKHLKNKQDIENWVNSRSIGEFFLQHEFASIYDINILNEFCKILVYNWERRLKELFPERNIVVEVGNEIMGEYGLTITMYEKTN